MTMTVDPEDIALVSVDDELSEEWSNLLDPRAQAMYLIRAPIEQIESAFEELASALQNYLARIWRQYGPLISRLYEALYGRPQPPRKNGRGRRAPANRRRRVAAIRRYNGPKIGPAMNGNAPI